MSLGESYSTPQTPYLDIREGDQRRGGEKRGIDMEAWQP